MLILHVKVAENVTVMDVIVATAIKEIPAKNVKTVLNEENAENGDLKM
jgi:hypothetical protein